MLGYNRNSARPVVFAPVHLGGIGLPSLSIESDLSKIMYTVYHLRANTRVGQYLHMTLDWYATHCDTRTSLWNPSTLPYAPTGWANHLHRIIIKFDIHIHTRIQMETPYRVNNRVLMDDTIQMNHPPRVLRIINAFRLSARVATLSDCTTGDGTTFEKALLRYPPTTTSQSTRLWPRQQPQDEYTYHYGQHSRRHTDHPTQTN